MIKISVVQANVLGHTETVVNKDDLISTRDIETLKVDEDYFKILD